MGQALHAPKRLDYYHDKKEQSSVVEASAGFRIRMGSYRMPSAISKPLRANNASLGQKGLCRAMHQM